MFSAATRQVRPCLRHVVRPIGSSSRSPNQVDLSKPWGRKAYELVDEAKPFHPEDLDVGVPHLQPDVALANTKLSSDAPEPSKDQYLEAMAKATSGPQSHVKLVEEELAEEVAAALKKQSDKVLTAIAKAEHLRRDVESELSELKPLKVPDLKSMCKELGLPQTGKKDSLVQRCLSSSKLSSFESARSAASHARWELLIHRQACGFVTNNNQFIETHYPIPEKITFKKTNEPPAKVFTDQLEWWQSKGRWR
ncbi:hypothetical protein TrST_g9119 [Triparma strigata]|uniref:SAP domain-containing protein n=1 Tax=Triparma strigata TaxID=1606541 RepID=A0A9W7E9Q9_9STRA|nr:hypothetical protein TrST_g9119 [Triparma strigata]